VDTLTITFPLIGRFSGVTEFLLVLHACIEPVWTSVATNLLGNHGCQAEANQRAALNILSLQSTVKTIAKAAHTLCNYLSFSICFNKILIATNVTFYTEIIVRLPYYIRLMLTSTCLLKQY
jgi:hypothetical protein